MVKKAKSSISEDDGDLQVESENRKRPADGENQEVKKPKRIKNLYHQPTVNELNRLQETETLFNSNLFRLQVEEVLEEVKIKEKTEKKFQQWFSDFKNHLESIPEDDTEYDLTEQTLTKKLKVKLPITEQLQKTKCVFKFHKFKSVEIVGSYALGCAINSKLRIDVQITVPAETYTKNDSINYRYHKKRAAYLAYIAAHLTKFESIEDLHNTFPDVCEAKPVIDLKPAGKLSNHFTVRLNLTCEAEAYKTHRFSPSRNNLRESWLLNTETSENNKEIGPPTPHYNSQVLADLTAADNFNCLKEALLKSENLKQAIVLLKIWIRQRNLQISGHIINLYVLYLVQTKRINNIMSSYQIVRNVWIALKTSEWDTKGISLNKNTTAETLSEFVQHFPVTFLDVTGHYNICYNVSKGTYNALKRECGLAVDMLDNTKINSFSPLFMVPVKPLLQFDYILRFKNIPALIQAIINKAPISTRLNYGIDQLPLVVETIHKLLNKGLGERALLILQMVENEFSWSVKKSVEKAKEKQGYKEKLSFGFILCPDTAFNVVQKGPPANLPEAEEFRAFWGEKSELRRFTDGSITETCVWEGDTMAELRGVTRQIVDYLLKFNYAIPPSDLFHIYDQLDSLCARKQYIADCSESSLEVVRAFDELRRDVRALSDLPLDISALYGVSPVFSYCDPFPPLPHGVVKKPWQRGRTCLIKDSGTDGGQTCVPEYTPVAKAIVELGHSGKWPGDLEAFRAVKAAFHMQIADKLHKQFSLATHAYATHVDVLKGGFVFRLIIAHPKERTLLRRETVNGVVKYRDTEESISLQCDCVLLPRLRSALHGLHQKYPAYGPTTCLFKRWLSSHLLYTPHFPPTVAELLTAAAFVHSHPLAPPTMPTVGLLRVLQLLATTDWRTEMIVLDFNDDLTREEIVELENKFNSRENFTPYIYIATAYDGELSSIWSSNAPSIQVVTRVCTLAKQAMQYANTALLEDTKGNLLGAFIPSLQGYDAIIHLDSALVPYNRERIDQQPTLDSLPEETTEDIIPVVEFNPVERYLEELRSAYSEFALFFHDSFGGDVIAVLWKPDVHHDKQLQILNATALKPYKSKGETKYKINTAAILEDFRILGRGLVRVITVSS